ncbi:MAG TPA: S8 family serine peptidase, partial [Solirubrobacteraceae bacterium]
MGPSDTGATPPGPPTIEWSLDSHMRGRSSTHLAAQPTAGAPRLECSILLAPREQSSTRPAPTTTRRRATTASLAAILATLLPLTGASPAAAEYKTTTAQALTAHAEWLPYAPPPANGAAAVCLVDTGVDINPDTATTVVDRIALDGGDPGDQSPSKHGTQMAMIMGAPINDWGMVGFWPGVRIVSVRAAIPGRDEFTFAAYANGVASCEELAARHRIVAVELALGSPGPSSQEEVAAFVDRVDRAREQGMSVVAAAGNAD